MGLRIMLTGATGFLGSHLARALVRNKHHVVILKRSFSDCSRLGDIAGELTSYDLDKTELRIPFERHQPFDAIIHTATAYGRRDESDAALVETNVTFPLQLLQASIQHGTELFLNTDTFSRTALAWQATYMLGYHLTKKQFAEWGSHLSAIHQTTFANLRLEHIYGPFDQSSKFIPFITNWCLRNIAELAVTAGEQKRDFVYVDDAVNAYLVLLENRSALPKGFVEYQVGTGQATSIRELVQKIHALTHSSIELKFGAIPYREKEIMCSQADTTALERLDWKSKVRLEDGLAMMLEREEFAK